MIICLVGERWEVKVEPDRSAWLVGGCALPCVFLHPCVVPDVLVVSCIDGWACCAVSACVLGIF